MLEDIIVRESRKLSPDDFDQRVVDVLLLLDIPAAPAARGGVDYLGEGVDPADEDLLFVVRTILGRRFGVPEAGR